MAQNAAQPLLNLRDKLIDLSRKTNGKPDTAWHDEMVRKANESFRKESRRKTIKSPPLQGKTIGKKPTASKASSKRKVAGKQ